MDKQSRQFILQSLELMEQSFTSQIRALRGLVLGMGQEETVEIPKVMREHVEQREIEDRLEATFADLANIQFAKGVEDGGNVSQGTDTDA